MTSKITYIQHDPVETVMVDGLPTVGKKFYCVMTGTSLDRLAMSAAEMAQLADGSSFIETDTFDVYVFCEATQSWNA